jgi:hypothetical protein
MLMAEMSGKSTGQMVGMVLGAVVGAVLAYPTGGMSIYAGLSLGATVGGIAGGVAGALYDSTNPAEIVNAQDSIADILLQTSAYGQAIPQVVGRYRLAGNIIDMGPKTEHENRESQDSGKGGGPRQVTITKNYTVSLDIALCDTRIFGAIAGIAKIWADNTLIYDNAQMVALPDGWTLYTGTAPQTPDPTFESIRGAGNVPGYPYLCHVVAEDYDMGQNPRVPNFNFEIYQGESQQNPLTQIAISPSNGDVWVAVPTLGQVWRYDETTRQRIATITVTADPPLATTYGFNLHWQSTNVLWVTDPVAYKHYRIQPGTNTVDVTISEQVSAIGNQVESGGYLWMGFLNYEQVVLNDEYAAVIGAYNASGIGAFLYNQTPVAVRSWLRLCVGADGNIWSFSDEDDGNNSLAIRINHTTGDQSASVALGVNAVIKDVLTGADGHIWVCNYTLNVVQRIDPASNTIVATVAVGAGPVQAGLASDNYIWVASADRVVTRINPATNATQSFQSDTPNVISPNNSIWAQGPSGAMWLCCTDDWTVQRFSTTGTTITVRTGASPRAIAAGASNTVWVVCASGDLQQISDSGAISAQTSVSGTRLPDVVGKLCEAAGLTSSDYDVTALDTPQVIAGIVNVVAVRAPLEQLAIAHNFALIESNRKLVFKRRGREAIAAVIPEADLDASDNKGETPGLAITRMQESELPTTLSFNYTSPTRNYQQNTQMAFVSNSQLPTENGRVVSTNIGLSDLEAKERAQELLDRLWVERNSYQARIGRKYAYLEPMDRIQITSRTVTHTVTITEATYGRPGILELRGKSDSAATQYVIGALPGDVPVDGQQVGYLAHTTARLLNLPALGNTDQVARYHVAYEYPNATGFPGATLHRSPDGGTSYALKHQGIIKGITGTVATALANADWHFLDTTSTFTVYVVSGTLSSISDVQLYNGGNLAMLGSELLQFGVATLVDTRTYTCSRLLRGRRGTEWAVSGHGANEQFAMVDAGAYRIEHDLSERNYTVPFKSVTNGLLISTVTAQNFAPTDENLIPFEIYPDAIRDSGTGDWTIFWYQRSRFFGDWVNLVGTGYDPDHLGYKVEIYNAGFAAVVRTTTVALGADPEALVTLTYSAAQQTTDFGGTQTTLRFKAYQIASGGISRATATTKP